jgi:site-specific DNA-methyltransferase (adenine-specific)
VQIVYKKVSDLIPYVNNARKNDHAVDAVASSIKNYGFKQPIVIDSQGEVIAGHTRLKASKKLGLQEVPCIVADDLTPAQIKAYRIADNRVGELAEWDMELLQLELSDIEEFTGFEDLIFDDENEPKGNDEDFNVDKELNEIEVPITKRGWIYKLGNHRLMCGDSTNEEDVKKLMNGKYADCVFTDPPYGYKYESNYQKKFDMLKNDDKILDFFYLAYEYMNNDSCIFVFGSHQNIEEWKVKFKNTFEYRNMIIWKKNNWSMGDLKCSFAGQHEIILYGNKGRLELKGKRHTDVWEFDRVKPDIHPTQKPVELIIFGLENTTNINQNVLDFFGGSGSTLIACEELNRNCFMMELDEKYCDVIVKRWENATGKKAERIE